MLFSFRLRDPILFRSMVDVISQFVDHLSLELSEDGLRIETFDSNFLLFLVVKYKF